MAGWRLEADGRRRAGEGRMRTVWPRQISKVRRLFTSIACMTVSHEHERVSVEMLSCRKDTSYDFVVEPAGAGADLHLHRPPRAQSWS